jgi:hypothetical protein
MKLQRPDLVDMPALPAIPEGRYAIARRIDERDWGVSTGDHMDESYGRSIVRGFIEGIRNIRPALPWPVVICLFNDLGHLVEWETYSPPT